jgi:hypothetical protein
MLFAAAGDYPLIYFGPHTLTIAGRDYDSLPNFKLVPTRGGFLLEPLRPLPPGRASLTFAAGVVPDVSVQPIKVRQAITFGAPCWVRSCKPDNLIPPPVLPLGGVIPFDGTETPYLAGGWSNAEPGWRWTEGNQAGLRMRVPPAHAYALDIEGWGYVPTGGTPLSVHVTAGVHEILSRSLPVSTPTSLRAKLSAEELGMGRDGSIVISIVISNPRRPRDYDPASHDARELGLNVTKFSLQPLP